MIVESGPDELSVVASFAEIATSAGSLECRSIKPSIDVPLSPFESTALPGWTMPVPQTSPPVYQF